MNAGFLDVDDPHRAYVWMDPEPRASGSGVLAGQPVAVKDNIAVRGAPWACGSATRRTRGAAEVDAEAVRRVRAAGGVVVGTTNLDELAMGAPGRLRRHHGLAAASQIIHAVGRGGCQRAGSPSRPRYQDSLGPLLRHTRAKPHG